MSLFTSDSVPSLLYLINKLTHEIGGFIHTDLTEYNRLQKKPYPLWLIIYLIFGDSGQVLQIKVCM